MIASLLALSQAGGDFQAVKGTETFYDFTGCTSGLAHQKIVGEQFAWGEHIFQSKGM